MRLCAWCNAASVGPGQRYCTKKCRQTAFRLRKRLSSTAPAPTSTGDVEPGAFEVADPPYPGMAWMYKDQPSYAGEVDHAALIARLSADYDAGRLTGWALCTSSKTAKQVLALVPYEFPVLRLAGWFKPVNASEKSQGMTSRWEPVLIVGGRKLRPGFPDWFDCPEPPAIRTAVARQGGESLIGRKPLAYAAFVFDCLGMVAGDSLVDTFPGTGIFSKAWRSLEAHASLVAGARQLLLPSLLDREATP